MSKQPEALRLAEACDNLLNHADNSEVVPHAAAELRRLHSLNAELVDALEGTFSLSIAWAANYQAMHKLEEFHPAHAGIVNGARDVLAKAEAKQ